MNFFLRQDVGQEVGLARQLGPARLRQGGMGGKPVKIAAKLPHYRGVYRDANGLALGLAGQPSENRLIETPASVFSCIFFEKPIELPQREFALRISIAEAPLESEKTLEFARQRTVELGCHRGTGKATWRNRRRATRTYTEVEEGRRWPKMSPTTFGLTPASICRVA